MTKKQNDAPDVQIKRRKLTEYQTDPNNANRGTPRGRRMIKDSLTELGPGRSLVSDSSDVLIAGNQTFEAAKEAGITEVIEVIPPPGVMVVVKRADLDLKVDDKAKRLGRVDNRASEVDLNFDTAVLLGDIDLLDVDPYGAAFDTIEAFFTSRRPFAQRMAVAVNCGGRQKLTINGGWLWKTMRPIVEKYGNDLHGVYLEICRELVTGYVAHAGYAVSHFGGYYAGVNSQLTHYLVMLERR